jgi:hypothetical protein
MSRRCAHYLLNEKREEGDLILHHLIFLSTNGSSAMPPAACKTTLYFIDGVRSEIDSTQLP